MIRSRTPNIPLMFRQSVDVITRPSVRTFERYERDGTFLDAVVYVALVGAVVSLLQVFTGGLGAWLGNTLVILGGFLVFVLVTYFFGRSQGGTGTLDEVAYTFSLFTVPVSVLVTVASVILSVVLAITIIGILLIPLVWIAGWLINVYFAYLAVQSSLNFSDPPRVLTVLVVAAIASWLAQLVLRLMLF